MPPLMEYGTAAFWFAKPSLVVKPVWAGVFEWKYVTSNEVGS